MRRALLGVLLLAAAAACSGSAKKNADEPVASKVWADGPPPPDAAPPPDSRLSQAECTSLFDHIAKLMQEGVPPDEWAANKDDLAAAREGMIKACQEGETTRAQYACLMKAESLPAVKDCVPVK